jgi:phosphoglycolate phosphatase-like HAD superfamily hydrolase
VAPTAPAVAAFRDAYRRRLELRLQDRSRCRALPGVLDLLGALRRRRAITLGLLTGNYADTGSMKLRACGIEPEWFAVRVWGDDSPHEPPSRDHLPGIGLSRYADLRGARLDPGRATVIGDTPHDVACARAHGCRSLGVATGSFLADALRDAGADHVVRDLSDTESMLRWLLA